MADDNVEVTPGELEDLGQFLQALKTIVLGLEVRVTYIEGFLTEAFSPEAEQGEGDALEAWAADAEPEGDPNDQYIDIQPANETSEAVNEETPEDAVRRDDPAEPEGV